MLGNLGVMVGLYFVISRKKEDKHRKLPKLPCTFISSFRSFCRPSTAARSTGFAAPPNSSGGFFVLSPDHTLSSLLAEFHFRQVSSSFIHGFTVPSLTRSFSIDIDFHEARVVIFLSIFSAPFFFQIVRVFL